MSVRPDFGDLLVAVAEDLDDIRLCVGCGADSTWAGLYVHENGEVSVAAWCDAPDCIYDRTDRSRDDLVAVPINHLPALRRKEALGGKP